MKIRSDRELAQDLSGNIREKNEMLEARSMKTETTVNMSVGNEFTGAQTDNENAVINSKDSCERLALYMDLIAKQLSDTDNWLSRMGNRNQPEKL